MCTQEASPSHLFRDGFVDGRSRLLASDASHLRHGANRSVGTVPNLRLLTRRSQKNHQGHPLYRLGTQVRFH